MVGLSLGCVVLLSKSYLNQNYTWSHCDEFHTLYNTSIAVLCCILSLHNTEIPFNHIYLFLVTFIYNKNLSNSDWFTETKVESSYREYKLEYNSDFNTTLYISVSAVIYEREEWLHVYIITFVSPRINSLPYMPYRLYHHTEHMSSVFSLCRWCIMYDFTIIHTVWCIACTISLIFHTKQTIWLVYEVQLVYNNS